MSIKLNKIIQVDLTGLTREEAETVESVLCRAERIKGNGVTFQRKTSKSSYYNPTKLVNGLITSALLSPKTGVFSDFSSRKTKRKLSRWQPVQKPIMIDLQVLLFKSW